MPHRRSGQRGGPATAVEYVGRRGRSAAFLDDATEAAHGREVVSAREAEKSQAAMDGTGRLSSPSSRPSLQRSPRPVVLEEVSAGELDEADLPHRYPLDELVMQLAEHGVLRAPQRGRTVEHPEPLPCLEVLVDAVVLGGDGHEGRKDDGTDLVIGGERAS